MFSFSGIVIYLIFICAVSNKERRHFRSQQVFSHQQIDRKQDSLKDVEKDGINSHLENTLSKEKLQLDQIIDKSKDTTHETRPKEELQLKTESKEKSEVKENTIENDQITVEIDLKQKEAKIIDLLDQVLQAEEDSYIEIVSLKEENIEDKNMVPIPLIVDTEPTPHRKSLSDLSDAGSDASFGNQVLSKYDVIVQVHREDLPKVNEDVEKETNLIETNEEHEEMTAFNDSETNSRTDESGYSDTIDKSALNDSTEDAREDIPYIPVPPPLDENYFTQSYFKASYSVPKRSKRLSLVTPAEESKPRISVQSSNSNDGTIVFGSDRQITFMSKLSNIFKNKIEGNDEVNLKRSNCTGNLRPAEKVISPERPSILLELNKEILTARSSPILRPIATLHLQPIVATPDIEETETEGNDDDSIMSREDLKSKLENIFATGGPKPLKSRLMKSNPPTPEEAYQTDTSSAESIQKLPMMDKNDTLKRQRDKFSNVLNSFRLSFNNDDVV